MSANNDKINVTGNQGDIIGIGIDGNGNIIGKNVSIVINELSQDCGLTLLHPNHFIENADTEENVQQWREKGYQFSLEAVYKHNEFRREKILKEIRDKLEDKKRLLILGESGTSKTTLLKEIICDYFDKNYRVLYNLGDDIVKDANTITEKIKGLAYANNRVLVVIDDVHSHNNHLIFSVIKKLQPLNKEKKDNILFLLAARQPDYDWVFEKNLWNDTDSIENVEELFNENYKYQIPYFELDEVKDFIFKYGIFLSEYRKYKTIEQNANEIFEDTNGYPIMVRFSVLNEGLDVHVKKMYRDYLVDNNIPNANKLRMVFLSSLFDISNVILKDEMLQQFALLDAAEDLKNTIIKKTGDIWKTIHGKWDMQLFRHVFSLKYNLYLVEKSFNEITKDIILKDNITNFEKISVLNTIYYIFTTEKVITLNTLEKILDISDIENKLDDFSKMIFYSNVIGVSYQESNRCEDAINFFDKALKIKPDFVEALNNKGYALYNLRKYNEVIEWYDKALKINPKLTSTLNNKGLYFKNKRNYNESIEYFDKALEIKPDFVDALYNKGNVLSYLGKYNESIEYFDKALEINPKSTSTLSNKNISMILCAKGNAFVNLGRYNDAIEWYDKVIAINPDYHEAMNGKGAALFKLERYNDAIEWYDKAHCYKSPEYRYII